MVPECFLCRKHAGQESTPPGGFFYENTHWYVCHGSPFMAGLGTIVVEARRHFLDFAEMNEAEAASYGVLLGKLYTALRAETGAPRIYTAIFLEGTPHFHTWLVPRMPEEQLRSAALLARDDRCTAEDAEAMSVRLRAQLRR